MLSAYLDVQSNTNESDENGFSNVAELIQLA